MSNQIIPFKTYKGEFLAVEVPSGANCFSVEFSRLCFNDSDNMPDYVMLESDDYTIIATSTAITEEQRRSIVSFECDSLLFQFIGELFRNYVNHSDPVYDSVQSFTSLMQSIGCDMSKTYLILKQ